MKGKTVSFDGFQNSKFSRTQTPLYPFTPYHLLLEVSKQAALTLCLTKRRIFLLDSFPSLKATFCICSVAEVSYLSRYSEDAEQDVICYGKQL